MNAQPWQREFDGAIAAVREAALLARELRDRFGERVFKADRSPVTVADFAVQAVVAERLRQAFPGDSLVAEEDSAALRRAENRLIRRAVLDALHGHVSGLSPDRLLDVIDRDRGVPASRFWTLDPVDGTQAVHSRRSVRGRAGACRRRTRGDWTAGCPALASPEQPREAVGGIACAVRNQGAFRQLLTGGEYMPLHVSSRRFPSNARILRSFEGDHIDLPAFNRVVEALHVDEPPRLVDSQAKHALIAAGQADLVLRIPASPAYRDKIWDQAAGTLIVEEAGGRVTDLDGVPSTSGADAC